MSTLPPSDFSSSGHHGVIYSNPLCYWPCPHTCLKEEACSFHLTHLRHPFFHTCLAYPVYCLILKRIGLPSKRDSLCDCSISSQAPAHYQHSPYLVLSCLTSFITCHRPSQLSSQHRSPGTPTLTSHPPYASWCSSRYASDLQPTTESYQRLHCIRLTPGYSQTTVLSRTHKSKAFLIPISTLQHSYYLALDLYLSSLFPSFCGLYLPRHCCWSLGSFGIGPPRPLNTSIIMSSGGPRRGGGGKGRRNKRHQTGGGNGGNDTSGRDVDPQDGGDNIVPLKK